MLDVQQDDVAPESSTGSAAPVPSTDPSSAGTQNTEQQQGQVVTDSRGNVIPPWRVNEMVQQASERAVAQAEARFAQERQQLLQSFDQRSQAQQQTIMQALQQRAAQPSRTPQEEAERRQAGTLVDGLLKEHPEWANALKYAKAGPALAQAAIENQKANAAIMARQNQIEQRQMRAYISSEEGRVREMARSAGMSAQLGPIFHDVTRIIQSDPEVYQAWVAGDPDALEYAFETARKERAGYAQPGRAALADTKTATRNLPPPLRGGVPGSPASPALPKFDPSNPGARERLIFKNAREAIRASVGSGG
jgi:hypothetical protein